MTGGDDTRAEWLRGLKVGDEVAVPAKFSGTPMIHRIDGETPQRWKVGRVEYRKRDGRRVGGDAWSSSIILPVTDDVRSRIRRAKAVDRFCDFANRFHAGLPIATETIEAVNALLTEGNPSDAP